MVTWTPTAENINALPEGVRDYIHRLETFTGSAGLIQENAALREENQALRRMLEEAPEGWVVGQSGPDFFGKCTGAIVQMADPASVKGKRVRLVVVDE